MSNHKKSLTIAIDASRSIDSIQKTGVELVSDEIIKKIADCRLQIADCKFIFYTPEKISWLPQEKQKVITTPKNRLWTMLGLSLEMLKNKPDILFIPVHAVPFFAPQKTFAIIHDIEFKFNKKSYSFLQRAYLNFILWQAARSCHKIFTMTHKVKADILRFTKLAANKIIVVPHGYTPKNKKELSHQNRLKQILYIGRIELKKNLINLIQAFQIFADQHPDFKLILVGKPGIGFELIKKQAQKNKDKIIFTGYISEAKKQQLLSTSNTLVHISTQEGFCFPMLEAFDFNLPVLAANTQVLREVGADACLYTDPKDKQKISDNLEKIIFDDKLRQVLIQAGQTRLKHFNWQKTIEQILLNIIKT